MPCSTRPSRSPLPLQRVAPGKAQSPQRVPSRLPRRGGRVALLDWEPQGSLTLWWVMRGKPDNPRLIREDVEPAEALRKHSEPTSHPTEGAVAKLIAYACL